MATAPSGDVAVGSTTPAPTAARAVLSAETASTSSHAAADVCRRFAAAAFTVDDATPTLGQARRAAARRFGTPRLQALYDGAGQGRDPQQELWRARGARVTPQVQLVDDPHGHDPLPEPIDQPGRPQVDVLVTGFARAADGWIAGVQPYRRSCLLLADPVRGWLVDDVDTEPRPDGPAATDGS